MSDLVGKKDQVKTADFGGQSVEGLNGSIREIVEVFWEIGGLTGVGVYCPEEDNGVETWCIILPDEGELVEDS